MATHIPTGETARFELKGERFRLGRATSEADPDKLAVTFDPKLSRRLALLEIRAGVVYVERDGSRYPLFHEGREKERFQILPGQRFTSGETIFELHEEMAHTMTVQVMERVNQTNPGQILQVLLGLQKLLNRWHAPRELAEESVELLQGLLPGAEIVFFEIDDLGKPEALTRTTLRASRSLVSDCLVQNEPVYHSWSAAGGVDQPTQYGDEHWALAAPIVSSLDRLVLYAVGRHSDDNPGELARGSLALVARTLSQHLEGRRALLLSAEVEAKARANEKLRILLETVEHSMSLQESSGIEESFLQGARRLTGAASVRFARDLTPHLEEGPRTLAVCFERSAPQGLLCGKEEGSSFSTEDKEWLEALAGFAETVLENRRLHRQVRESLSKLKQSQEQLVLSSQWAAAGRLAANAAHELNTPLGAIKLSAENALTFLPGGPKQARENLRLIERSVDRCRRVTERLLVYSRSREKREIETFSLLPVVEDGLQSVEYLMESRRVEHTVELDPAWKVRGDRADCYWAVTNVLRNALDALAAWDGKRSIRLRGRGLEDRIWLSITDSGPGIVEAHRTRLFEPFFSTRKMGEGNGLGLAVSRENLRRWKADVRLEGSGPAETTFTIDLPRGV